MGSDDETIIRIFVLRAEVDLRWGKKKTYSCNQKKTFNTLKTEADNFVYQCRVVAEKYKEVANRELKTAVEQVWLLQYGVVWCSIVWHGTVCCVITNQIVMTNSPLSSHIYAVHLSIIPDNGLH